MRSTRAAPRGHGRHVHATRDTFGRCSLPPPQPGIRHKPVALELSACDSGADCSAWWLASWSQWQQ
jgi:hypothetical protein